MDERQVQIRERAGLEESLLNQEFIDWLRKWGTPILFIAALAAVGYTVYLKYKASTSAKVDQAFAEYEAAQSGSNASPDALTAVAAEYEGVRAVSMLSRLAAADAYLDAVRRGMKIGAELRVQADERGTIGELARPEDALTEEDRKAYLAQAEALYRQVYDRAGKDSRNILTRINAMYGMAATAESAHEWTKAKDWYAQIDRLVEGTVYASHGKIAQRRIANVDILSTLPPVPSEAQIPKKPQPEPPAPEPAPAPQPAPPAPATPEPQDPGAPPK